MESKRGIMTGNGSFLIKFKATPSSITLPSWVLRAGPGSGATVPYHDAHLSLAPAKVLAAAAAAAAAAGHCILPGAGAGADSVAAIVCGLA